MSTGTTQATNGNGGSKATAMAPSELGNKKPAAKVNELRLFIDKMKSQFALALPKHLNVDRMQRLIMTEFSKNEKLQECSMHSIAAAVMTASQLGLEIGVNGQAYVIPYRNKSTGKMVATFVPGWKGLVDLVNRAGRSAAWTGAVFEGDEFSWELGDSPFVKHKPMGECNPDKLLYAYAIGRVNGSSWPVIECWDVKRIKAHRDKQLKANGGGDSHYSFKNFEMYARKVVLLQVLKYLPTSVELTAAIEISDRENDPRSLILDGDFITIEPSEVGEAEPQGEVQEGAK